MEELLPTIDKNVNWMKTIEKVNCSVNGGKYITLYKKVFRPKCGDKKLNLGLSKY